MVNEPRTDLNRQTNLHPSFLRSLTTNNSQVLLLKRGHTATHFKVCRPFTFYSGVQLSLRDTFSSTLLVHIIIIIILTGQRQAIPPFLCACWCCPAAVYKIQQTNRFNAHNTQFYSTQISGRRLFSFHCFAWIGELFFFPFKFTPTLLNGRFKWINEKQDQRRELFCRKING